MLADIDIEPRSDAGPNDLPRPERAGAACLNRRSTRKNRPPETNPPPRQTRSAAGPTGGYASSTSRAPASAAIDASASVAHLNFVIPSSTCRRTSAGILCVFTCGLRRAGPPATSSIDPRLCSTLSWYTTSAGVSTRASPSKRIICGRRCHARITLARAAPDATGARFFPIFGDKSEVIPLRDEGFISWQVPPEEMDRLWAKGWRHFGPLFYRYAQAQHGGGLVDVRPLRIDLARFERSKSQRRVWRRNEDLRISIRRTRLDETRRALFNRHKQRFTENVPDSLEDFLGADSSSGPCVNVEVAVQRGSRLLAASYLDLGHAAVSSIYGFFDPDESARSLGIFTMLVEIEFASSTRVPPLLPRVCLPPAVALRLQEAIPRARSI